MRAQAGAPTGTRRADGRSSARASALPSAGCVPPNYAVPGRGAAGLACIRAEHEALAGARTHLESDEGRRLYGQRQGIEATISQGVRRFGLRRARYRGLAKTTLQSVATAAALNLDRLAAWFALRPLAPTRTSRFKALTA